MVGLVCMAGWGHALQQPSSLVSLGASGLDPPKVTEPVLANSCTGIAKAVKLEEHETAFEPLQKLAAAKGVPGHLTEELALAKSNCVGKIQVRATPVRIATLM